MRGPSAVAEGPKALLLHVDYRCEAGDSRVVAGEAVDRYQQCSRTLGSDHRNADIDLPESRELRGKARELDRVFGDGLALQRLGRYPRTGTDKTLGV